VPAHTAHRTILQKYQESEDMMLVNHSRPPTLLLFVEENNAENRQMAFAHHKREARRLKNLQLAKKHQESVRFALYGRGGSRGAATTSSTAADQVRAVQDEEHIYKGLR
jgi:hypothetical protein